MPYINSIPLVKMGKSPAPIVILSDVHIGATEHCEREFDTTLAWIKRNKAWVILNGDIVENAIVSGKAPGEKLLGQALVPTDQLIEARNKLKPLAKRIVYSTRGNHESRTRREAMLDITELLSEMLGVPYAGVGGIIRFQAGSRVYTFGIQHGRSGGKNIWLETGKMLDLYPDADLVALGHNHALGAVSAGGIVVGKTGTETIRERWQVRTGSYLGFADYVREMMLRPGNVGSPIIHLDPARHKLTVDVETLSWPVM
jgi:predicted phosphodiesterase